ncbi:hypothetical protein BT96DRAFT_1050778, partial [Gymnopus androsaceus JB14]
MGRLLYTYQVNGKSYGIVYLTEFKNTRWVPNTKWDGCEVREEDEDGKFLFAHYLVCGAHMIQSFTAKKPCIHYLNDTIDNDWFLRAGN